MRLHSAAGSRDPAAEVPSLTEKHEMNRKTFTRGALLLQLAATAALLPTGPARAGDLQALLRLAGEQVTRSAAAPDVFGRTAVSTNYFTRAMGQPRHSGGKGGKGRK